MNLNRLKEIHERFKLALYLQKEYQQELETMQFTEHELKEIVDIIGELVFIKRNEAMIAKAMAAGAYGKAASDFKAIEEALKNEN